jgi:type III secretion system chaperone SycN
VNALEDVVAQFAAELGMGRVAVDAAAPAVFRFERSGRLFVEPRDARILVYLEGQEPVRDRRELIAALAACALQHRWAMPVRPGLAANDRLVFGVALEERDFTLPALHDALDLLIRVHTSVAARAGAR